VARESIEEMPMLVILDREPEEPSAILDSRSTPDEALIDLARVEASDEHCEVKLLCQSPSQKSWIPRSLMLMKSSSRNRLKQ
jgi:hypothetical protein